MKEAQPPRSTTMVGKVSRSNVAHLENNIIRKETNEMIPREANAKNLHEKGEVNHTNLIRGNILPTLGATGGTESESKGEIARTM